MHAIAPDLWTIAEVIELRGSTVCCIFVDRNNRPDLYGGLTWLKRGDIIGQGRIHLGDRLTVTFDAKQSSLGLVYYQPVFCEK